jgi:hypothetical protein
MHAGPTTQRDCVLFDQIQTPVYSRFGDAQLLPIEGVLGAIELNYGEHTSYRKIITDAAKLSEIGALARGSSRRMAQPISHLPADVDPSQVSPEEVIARLLIHQAFRLRPQLLIFAENIRGDLLECARRLMAHNKRVGIRNSVDGLFVLHKGYALHFPSNRAGWNTQRQPGDHFAGVARTPGQVLFQLQSIIRKHMAFNGMVHPASFDQYISPPAQAQVEMAASHQVSDMEYLAEPPEHDYVAMRA